jgi:hypothetical protein
MRRLMIAIVIGLALGLVVPPALRAAPAIGLGAAASAPVEDVVYVSRCHRAHIWRDTPRGRRLVTVRRCHRAWRP